MTSVIPDPDKAAKFEGDRYERLRQTAETWAADPAIENHEGLFNGGFVRAFATEIADAKILDGLSEKDANAAMGYLVLDCTKGPERLAWRVQDVLNGSDPLGCEDPCAVAAAVAKGLAGMLMAFSLAGTEEAGDK